MGLRGGTLLTGWKGALLKEWTFASDITAGSGLPLTPVYLASVQGTGVTGSIRPNYTGAPLYNAPAGLHLNPAAYSIPLPGQWGNAGRNTIIGPSQFLLNASLGRTFRLNDRFNLDLRFDSTNALNRVNFAAWNTTIGSPTFGLPSSANAMRSVETVARLRF
jgi:trimeric autotransporter adhesin